jgi:hypothetical protein
MTIRRVSAFLLALALGSAAGAAERASVCFSPGEDCAAALVREIAAAKKTVHVGIYYFSLKPVAEALIEP